MAVRAVHVVNLRGDAERWESVQRAFAPFPDIKLNRLEAVYGSALPDDVCVRLTHDPYSIIAKGALGCGLSHVRAWELIGRGPDPWALVIEDDATLIGLERLASLDMAPGLDYVFCNHRTQPDTEPLPGTPFGHHAIHDCLGAIESRHHAVGTDGYLISQAGAQRLVALFTQHGYFSHVDLRMLAYAVSSAVLESQLPDSSWLRRGLSEIKRVTGAAAAVAANVLSPAFTYHAAVEETSRTREDRLGQIGGRTPGT